MKRINKHFKANETPQSEALPGQVENNAGGFSFEVDKWARLERFLVLGTEGGTYYVNEKKLTRDNCKSIEACLVEDGLRVVETIVKISNEGRAANNDYALFALAMAAGDKNTATRRAALDALPKVARIGTHLFHFAEFVQDFRGWGRSLRKAIANWYLTKDVNHLALQAIKYKQRDGWSHRDLLRLAHPKTDDIARNNTFKYIVSQGETWFAGAPDLIKADFDINDDSKLPEVIDFIKQGLPRECIPTKFLDTPEVWEALLENMPLTATIRNLNKMTKVGVLKNLGKNSQLVCDRITDPQYIRQSRVHPIQILAALMTYSQGHGARGNLTWNPVAKVRDALDKAFYLSFKNVEPTGKNTLLALDISSSMTWGNIAGVPGLTPRVASAAMALVTERVEKNSFITAFCNRMVPVSFSSRETIDTVINKTDRLPFGGTDCALPMKYALNEKIEVDTFIVYTDSETWCGKQHPVQALKAYRDKMGRPSKLVVVGMEANEFTIADPNDAGMLDVVGFDTATPNIISNFSRG